MPSKTIRDADADFKARALRRDFERRRLADEELLDESVEQIKERLDDLKIEQLKNAANGYFDNELSVRTAKLEKELESRLKPAPEIAYYCGICKDTGIADGAYCTCYLNYIYLNCYNAVDIDGLTESFDSFNIKLFDDKKEIYPGLTQRSMMNEARKVLMGFINILPQSDKKKILISGQTGLGKTYLLRAAAKAARAKNIDVMLIEAPKLFNLFHKHRLGGEVDLSFLEKAKLLIIDDLGAEPVTTNVSNEYLYELLENRFNLGLYTIAATNETNLSDRYNERISSRLYSLKNGALIELEGYDLRNIRD